MTTVYEICCINKLALLNIFDLDVHIFSHNWDRHSMFAAKWTWVYQITLYTDLQMGYTWTSHLIN